MVYDHMVKVNGAYYAAGEDVPEVNTENAAVETKPPFSDSDITFETTEEKPYTKTDINTMNKEKLLEVAQRNGFEATDETTGAELKKYLFGVFGL